MADSLKESNSPLGAIAKSLSLLAIALLFTGWIYRWHYYTYYQVEPTSLGLSIESAYITAFSLLFGRPWSIARFLIGLALTVVGIVISFKALNIIRGVLAPSLERLFQRLGLEGAQREQLRLFALLVDELVIILCLLLVLYCLASHQGLADARRDAVNETSTLPLVTIVMPGKEAVIGRDLDKPFANPTDIRIFGNAEPYTELLGSEIQLEGGQRWRLLSDAGGKLLVIPSLPATSSAVTSKAPPVLMFLDGAKGDQLLILSPSQSG